MERILLFIKHNLKFLWGFIEIINSRLFSLLYGSKLASILPGVLAEYGSGQYEYRQLKPDDMESLFNLLNSQNPGDTDYFNPHRFDLRSLNNQLKNKAFLMMGILYDNRLAGYFFLRFFANKKCFVGRLIDKNHRGKGLGLIMNDIMYETSWRLGFRCLSTISRNNIAVIRAHSRNPYMRIIKDLPDNYMLVEFIKKAIENPTETQDQRLNLASASKPANGANH